MSSTPKHEYPTGAQISLAAKHGWNPNELWPAPQAAASQRKGKPNEIFGQPIPYISGPETPKLTDADFRKRIDFVDQRHDGDVEAVFKALGEDVEIQDDDGERMGFVVDLRLHSDGATRTISGVVQLAPEGKRFVRRALPGGTWLTCVFALDGDKLLRVLLSDEI